MTTNQRDRGAHFRALHQEPGAFVIPNPWDAGSARILASLGFEALATPSAAAAGARRISLAASLHRAAMTGMLDAAREVKEHGTFSYLDRIMTSQEWSRLGQL
ncbi:MAG TPA: isocitrate lyase/phosphoenolpyruvate mutase family protein [Opitutaceae bacterium]|nr:isocitrate lyase/phosphoenolpyruvate mutase family protein [Opitutaceae bacterium]